MGFAHQTNLTIAVEEQNQLLSKRNKIPPVVLRRYLSPDGQELWDTVNFEYFHFHAELKAYFQGLPSQLESLSNEWRDYLEAKKIWFLALYELIRKSWKYLTPYHKSDKGVDFTPGLLAAEILEAECKCSLLPATTGRVKVAPRRNYELSAKIAKAAHEKESKMDQLLKDYRHQLGEFDQLASLEPAILSYCRYAASEDKYVKDALKTYISATNNLDAVIYKHWEFRKGKQEIWENGSRKPLNKSLPFMGKTSDTVFF